MPNIRAVCLSDAPQIWRLLRQFATSYPPDEVAFNTIFPRLTSRADAVFVCVEQDSIVVGYLLGFETPTLFANGPILQIVELVVDEGCRGQGLGAALVKAAFGSAQTHGCVEAVAPTRRAAEFYERLGFVRTAEFLKLKIPG